MNDKLVTALETLDESLTHLETALDRLLTRQGETHHALMAQIDQERNQHAGMVQGMARRLDQAIARLEAALEDEAEEMPSEDREAS